MSTITKTAWMNGCECPSCAVAREMLAALEHQIYRNHPYSETCDACLASIRAYRKAKGEL